MQYHGTLITADGAYHCPVGSIMAIFSSVRSSNSHPDLLVITTTTTTPLFQITPVLNTGLSLSEPLQLYQTAFVYVTAISVTFCNSVLGAFVTKPLNQTHSHLNDKPVNGRKKP